MKQPTHEITAAQIAAQAELCLEIRRIITADGAVPLALVDTYGCQQNEADSERLRGYLAQMGYAPAGGEAEADVIVINTCAVREHAEQRVLGNVGALTHTKKAKRGQIIVLCGCMTQQEHMAEKIKKSFPIVDIVFGTHELWRFPELLHRRLTGSKRVVETTNSEGAIAEGLPVKRQGRHKAWLSVMYGCNNFCSYCVVPYVRGRERSRRAENVLSDAKALIADGIRDITLLGQNVNSYGRDLESAPDFPELIRRINSLPGDFLIRFMTSHPKDATPELFRAIASSEKCARHLHLPVQSGSSRVLKAMNRGYTREQYLEKIRLIRELVPDIVLTTDIIVGFPGETEAEFRETLSLIEEVRYDAMFTFIYSKREGTPAASLGDAVSREEKQRWFDELLTAANKISAEKHAAYTGTTQRVLIDGADAKDPGILTARTNGGRLVRLIGGAGLIGGFADVKITGATTWALSGQLIN
jgi:tRNA-2-methylthio-N6-dimethylallyladenosine synthase